MGNAGISRLNYNDARQRSVSSVVVEKSLRQNLIRLLPVHCCSVDAANSAKLVLSVAIATKVLVIGKRIQFCRLPWVDTEVRLGKHYM